MNGPVMFLVYRILLVACCLLWLPVLQEVCIFLYSGVGRISTLGWIFLVAQLLAVIFLLVATFVPFDWFVKFE